MNTSDMGWLKDTCERYLAGKSIYDVLVKSADPSAGKEMIVSPANLGDTVFIASLAKAYKRAHNINTLILVAKHRQAEAAEWFEGVDATIGLGDTELILLRYYFTISKNFYSNGIRYGHIPCLLTPDHPGVFFHEPPGFKEDSLMHIWEDILDVPRDCERSEIVIPDGITLTDEDAAAFRNAVLIAPAAFTNKGIPESFWEKTTSALTDKGYEVYCNSGGLDYDKKIKGTKDFETSTRQLILCAPLFHHIIGVRSGFTDLVCRTSAKLTVMHLDDGSGNTDLHIRYGTRLDDVRDFGRTDGIYPILYTQDAEDKVIEAVIENIEASDGGMR